MARPEHSQIPTEKLVELCSRSSYTLDGLWFSLVEEKFGLDAALEIDVEVWRRLCLIQARRVQKYFPIDEGSSIRNLIKIIELDPLLAVYEPKVVELADNRAILRIIDCPPQKARIRDGRGEFPCKPVGVAFLTGYATGVDPKIKLSCLSCPPDPHPSQFWCEWRFET